MPDPSVANEDFFDFAERGYLAEEDAGTVFSSDQVFAPYVVYDVRNKYIIDTGNLVLPTSPDHPPDEAEEEEGDEAVASPIILSVALPIAYRILTFNMERLGTRCDIPVPAPLEGEILMSMLMEEAILDFPTNGGHPVKSL